MGARKLANNTYYHRFPSFVLSLYFAPMPQCNFAVLVTGVPTRSFPMGREVSSEGVYSRRLAYLFFGMPVA